MLTMVSTRSEDIGQELNAVATGNSPVEALVVNSELHKVATASNGVIKFYDIREWVECP